jgi:hypothetical protein
MTNLTPKRKSYADPSIVFVGSVVGLTKQNIQGQICDGNPCTGNWYFAFLKEGEPEPEPHPGHDPNMPHKNPNPEGRPST